MQYLATYLRLKISKNSKNIAPTVTKKWSVNVNHPWNTLTPDPHIPYMKKYTCILELYYLLYGMWGSGVKVLQGSFTFEDMKKTNAMFFGAMSLQCFDGFLVQNICWCNVFVSLAQCFCYTFKCKSPIEH